MVLEGRPALGWVDPKGRLKIWKESELEGVGAGRDLEGIWKGSGLEGIWKGLGLEGV